MQLDGVQSGPPSCTKTPTQLGATPTTLLLPRVEPASRKGGRERSAAMTVMMERVEKVGRMEMEMMAVEKTLIWR